jgi:sigma-B regulation protein RsbU (phosphoserine phosphatase)
MPVRKVLEHCPIRTVPAGTILMVPGKSNDTIHFLLNGQLAAQLEDPLAPDRGIPIHPGESVGELSVIDGKPTSAYIVAMSEARVLDLPGALFWSSLAPIPGVLRNLISALTVRMRRSNEAILTAQRRALDLEHLRRELQVARQLQTSMIPLRGPSFPRAPRRRDRRHDDARFRGRRRLLRRVLRRRSPPVPVRRRCLRPRHPRGAVHGAHDGTRSHRGDEHAQPRPLLERINEQLCAGNDSNVFVTLFCAFLDVTTGQLLYSNAGHLAPIVAEGGRARLLPLPKGALVGVIPGTRYHAKHGKLDPGVTLVCFTDGVTEAYSAAGVEFSDERLLVVAADNTGRHRRGLPRRRAGRARELPRRHAARRRLHAARGAAPCARELAHVRLALKNASVRDHASFAAASS